MSTPTAPKLLLAYAADGGLVNAARHYVHKLLSPKTYPCRLCAMTYGPLGKVREWSCALERLPIEVEEIHRDELAARHPDAAVELPAILLESGRGLETLVSAGEIDGCPDVQALAALVAARVDQRLEARAG